MTNLSNFKLKLNISINANQNLLITAKIRLLIIKILRKSNEIMNHKTIITQIEDAADILSSLT